MKKKKQEVAINSPVMNINECAKYLGISTDTLYQYASIGTLPAFKLGNRWRFVQTLIDKWMVEQCEAREVREV